MGVKLMKPKFEDDGTKLVRLVTCNTDEMLKNLDNLILPSKFCRIMSIEDISFFFTNDNKENLFKLNLNVAKIKSLNEFNPNKINLK